jgi:putative SOS response-associated peptidase YedK
MTPVAISHPTFGVAMCGRFTLRTPQSVLVTQFALDAEPTLFPRYNIAPSQPVAVVRASSQEPAGALRELVKLRWGLVPSWAQDPSIGNQLINARSETAAVKPAFRSAMRHRRCLIPADGFYEWKKIGKQKQPYFIRRPDDKPFAFAGLWERWTDPEGRPLETCTILTTDANELLRPLHIRMPVIVEPADYTAWLDPSQTDPDRLRTLFASLTADQLVTSPVSTIVNSPANDDPRCLSPAEEEKSLFDSP